MIVVCVGVKIIRVSKWIRVGGRVDWVVFYVVWRFGIYWGRIFRVSYYSSCGVVSIILKVVLVFGKVVVIVNFVVVFLVVGLERNDIRVVYVVIVVFVIVFVMVNVVRGRVYYGWGVIFIFIVYFVGGISVNGREWVMEVCCVFLEVGEVVWWVGLVVGLRFVFVGWEWYEDVGCFV